jgi:hypothetical protein
MSDQRIVLMANNIDEVGGAQRVVHVLAQGFAERGHDVEVVGVTPQPPVHEYPDEPAYRRRVLMSEVWPTDSTQKELRARLRTEARERLTEVLASGPPGVLITSQVWAPRWPIFLSILPRLMPGDRASTMKADTPPAPLSAGSVRAMSVKIFECGALVM